MAASYQLGCAKLFKFSRTLFTKEDGAPYTFYFADKNEDLEQIIQKGSGELVDSPNKASFVLTENPSDGDGCLSLNFIVDCVKKQTFLNPKKYMYSHQQHKSSANQPSTSKAAIDNSDSENIDDSDDEFFRRSCGKKLNRSILKGRSKYVDTEDFNIILYLIDSRRYRETGGNVLWKHMEAIKVTDHTYQSMKARFSKMILPNIDSYNIPESWKRKLTGQRANSASRFSPAKKSGRSESPEIDLTFESLEAWRRAKKSTTPATTTTRDDNQTGPKDPPETGVVIRAVDHSASNNFPWDDEDLNTQQLRELEDLDELDQQILQEVNNNSRLSRQMPEPETQQPPEPADSNVDNVLSNSPPEAKDSYRPSNPLSSYHAEPKSFGNLPVNNSSPDEADNASILPRTSEHRSCKSSRNPLVDKGYPTEPDDNCVQLEQRNSPHRATRSSSNPLVDCNSSDKPDNDFKSSRSKNPEPVTTRSSHNPQLDSCSPTKSKDNCVSSRSRSSQERITRSSYNHSLDSSSQTLSVRAEERRRSPAVKQAKKSSGNGGIGCSMNCAPSAEPDYNCVPSKQRNQLSSTPKSSNIPPVDNSSLTEHQDDSIPSSGHRNPKSLRNLPNENSFSADALPGEERVSSPPVKRTRTSSVYSFSSEDDEPFSPPKLSKFLRSRTEIAHGNPEAVTGTSREKLNNFNITKRRINVISQMYGLSPQQAVRLLKKLDGDFVAALLYLEKAV